MTINENEQPDYIPWAERLRMEREAGYAEGMAAGEPVGALKDRKMCFAIVKHVYGMDPQSRAIALKALRSVNVPGVNGKEIGRV